MRTLCNVLCFVSRVLLAIGVYDVINCVGTFLMYLKMTFKFFLCYTSTSSSRCHLSDVIPAVVDVAMRFRTNCISKHYVRRIHAYNSSNTGCT